MSLRHPGRVSVLGLCLLLGCAPADGPIASGPPEPSAVTDPATPAAEGRPSPAPLEAAAVPGALVAVERVGAPVGAVAWRVRYRSESIHGRPIEVTGLIAAPDADAPTGGFPVLGWAHGTAGLADRCAPSRVARPIADGRVGPLPLPPFWEAGYVVAATDYEGLGTPGRHPYLVGGSEARGVLDAIRAARRLPDLHVSLDEAVVVGVSQGGHAALFSGEVAPDYAPDVDLAGIVALAPPAELADAALLLTLDPTVVGFAVAIGAGFEAAYPEADLGGVMRPEAYARLGVVDEGCIADVMAEFARPVATVLHLERLLEPPWPALLAANTPGRVPIGAPLFVGQGSADGLVVPELTDALVARLEALGDAVTYRRYADAGHLGILEAAWPDIRSWLDERLD